MFPTQDVSRVRVFTAFCLFVLPVAYAIPQGKNTCPADCAKALYDCGIGLGERKGSPVSKPFAVLDMMQVLKHGRALTPVNTGMVHIAQGLVNAGKEDRWKARGDGRPII